MKAKNNVKGQVFVICAPSGTGKSTLISQLTDEFSGIRFSVSSTTRPPREGEVHGKHYNFISKEEFLRLRDEGFFAEWAEVHGNFYGTPRQATIDMLEDGFDVLFDIDVQGARQLKESFGFGCYVMLLPPSRQQLEERLLSRGTDSKDVIEKRLNNARGELAEAGMFDYWLVNDDLDLAYEHLRAVYISQRLLPKSDPGLVDRILATWEEK